MDLTSEKARLLQRDADWAAVVSEGTDVEAILSYWTDDAVVVAPGLPVISGKNG
jgi:ketosteroid isomerase-like protein